MYFVYRIISLLFVHFGHIYDFHDIGLIIFESLHLYRETEWTFTDDFQFPIFIHFSQ